MVGGAGAGIAIGCGGSGVTGEMSMPHESAIEPKELAAVISTEWVRFGGVTRKESVWGLRTATTTRRFPRPTTRR